MSIENIIGISCTPLDLVQRINDELGLNTPDLTTPLDYIGGIN